MTDSALNTSLDRDDRLLCLTLNRPKANIVDAEMIDQLQASLDGHLDNPRLSALLINAQGPHFSFGASVPEHLPDQCAAMLTKLHKLLLTLVEAPVPVLCSVRGMCLGGGLELALGSDLMFAGRDAAFGQPEITLAVFAPAASCLLPERVGRGNAADLLFSGRTVDAETALRWGLAQSVDDSPDEAARRYFDEHLAPRSAFALRHAVRAARGDLGQRLRADLDRVEKLYVQELMAGRDPLEGLNAFIEKRQPTWEHC